MTGSQDEAADEVRRAAVDLLDDRRWEITKNDCQLLASAWLREHEELIRLRQCRELLETALTAWNVGVVRIRYPSAEPIREAALTTAWGDAATRAIQETER